MISINLTLVVVVAVWLLVIIIPQNRLLVKALDVRPKFLEAPRRIVYTQSMYGAVHLKCTVVPASAQLILVTRLQTTVGTDSSSSTSTTLPVLHPLYNISATAVVVPDRGNIGADSNRNSNRNSSSSSRNVSKRGSKSDNSDGISSRSRSRNSNSRSRSSSSSVGVGVSKSYKRSLLRKQDRRKLLLRAAADAATGSLLRVESRVTVRRTVKNLDGTIRGSSTKEDVAYYQIVLHDWVQLIPQYLHLRLTSALGTVISPSFQIKLYKLGKFTERGDEYIEFVMGNVAQVVCETPPSEPSPPQIQFYFNNRPLQISNYSSTAGSEEEDFSSLRYRIIQFPPYFDRVALLIRNVRLEDSGVYRCMAGISGTLLSTVSEKTTHLSVKVPKQNIAVRFRVASHINIGQDKSAAINVTVPVGVRLVLYCVYESAPLQEVTWYWGRSDRNYVLDSHFGTLTIRSTELEDSSDISCLTNGDNGKIFRITVYELPKVVATPAVTEITKKDFGKKYKIKCKGNIKKIKRKIKWFFNGQSILTNKDLVVKGNRLTILTMHPKHLGIFQCWYENPKTGKWYSDTALLKMKETVKPTKVMRETKTVRGNSEQFLTCSSTDFKIDRNVYIVWFDNMQRQIKPGVQYNIIQNPSKNSSLLQINNVTNQDTNTTLTCRIYSNTDRSLRAEKKFIVMMDSIKSKDEDDQMSIAKQKPKNSLPYQITKPTATLSAKHLLLVNLSWSLESAGSNMQSASMTNVINHFRVEYEEGTVDNSAISSRLRSWRLADGGVSILWRNSTLIDKSFTKTHVIIYGPVLLKPQKWYRFRVLAIPNISYVQQLSFDQPSQVYPNNFYQKIRSAWSKPINFEHIIPARPKIFNYTILSNNSINLIWRYKTTNGNSALTKYQSSHNCEFKVVYVPAPTKSSVGSESNSVARSPPVDSWYDVRLLSTRSLRYSPSPNDLLNPQIQTVTLLSSSIYYVHQINISGLISEQTYLVSIYAIHRPEVGAARIYSSISRPYSITAKSLQNVNDKASVDTKSNTTPSTTKAKYQNKILFLILGSLAGILFVIAFSMFVMCLWYQIKYHSKKRQTASASSSIKTSSNHTFVPSSSVVPALPNSCGGASSTLLFSSSSNHHQHHFQQHPSHHKHMNNNLLPSKTGESLGGTSTLPISSSAVHHNHNHHPHHPTMSHHNHHLLPRHSNQSAPPITSGTVTDATINVSHLYLAQHLSLWSPDHLAQFNLPNNLQDRIIEENGTHTNSHNGQLQQHSHSATSKSHSGTTTTISTSSQKSNMDIDINNLDGSIEDSQEESVRLLDYQPHSSTSRREEQCTLNNAFSVQSEVRETEDLVWELNGDYGKSISHYPFSPSALDLYSQKKKAKFNPSNRKDFSNLKFQLKNYKLNNVNNLFPIRTRLSCFFPNSHPSSSTPPPASCAAVSSSDDSPPNTSFPNATSGSQELHHHYLHHHHHLPKDDTFAEHPFMLIPPPATDYIQKRCVINHHHLHLQQQQQQQQQEQNEQLQQSPPFSNSSNNNSNNTNTNNNSISNNININSNNNNNNININNNTNNNTNNSTNNSGSGNGDNNNSLLHQPFPTSHYFTTSVPDTKIITNKSKFLFDPTTDLSNQDDSISNSTANSARHFSYSMFPDGVRPCINLDLDKPTANSQTNL